MLPVTDQAATAIDDIIAAGRAARGGRGGITTEADPLGDSAAGVEDQNADRQGARAR
jgi:hypothetical protein